MYGPRGTMMRSTGYPDGFTKGYESAKRQRMMTNSSPYISVGGGRSITGGLSDGYDAAVGSKRPHFLGPTANPYLSGPTSNLYQSFGSNNSISNKYSFPAVRLRGLPFDCEDLDVYNFFEGLDVVDCLMVNKHGRFTGEAFVVFSSPLQADLALGKNRQNMGHRYIEVFPSNKQEYYQTVASEVALGEGQQEQHGSPPPRPKKAAAVADVEYTEVLKLRGLPYSTTESDIAEFFEEYGLTEENVKIARRRTDGRATGEAYAQFPSAQVAQEAMCKDRMTIGSRYVELFPSTAEEAKRAMSRFKG